MKFSFVFVICILLLLLIIGLIQEINDFKFGNKCTVLTIASCPVSLSLMSCQFYRITSLTFHFISSIGWKDIRFIFYGLESDGVGLGAINLRYDIQNIFNFILVMAFLLLTLLASFIF